MTQADGHAECTLHDNAPVCTPYPSWIRALPFHERFEAAEAYDKDIREAGRKAHIGLTFLAETDVDAVRAASTRHRDAVDDSIDVHFKITSTAEFC